MPLVRNETESWQNKGIAHINLRGMQASSLIVDNWKIVQNGFGEHRRYPELYELSADPHEEENLGESQFGVSDFLDWILRSEEANKHPAFEPSFVDTTKKELRRELEALGYLQ